MQSSTNAQPQIGFFTRQKNKISQLTNGWMLELSLIATILFCISFWYDLPDLNINPVLGKGISAVGVLVLFSIIAFKLKWPVIIGVAGMVVYIGINFIQGGTLKDIASHKQEQNHSSFVNNNNVNVLSQQDSK
jgi:hypothetical protein